jgi:hypothetical protein
MSNAECRRPARYVACYVHIADRDNGIGWSRTGSGLGDKPRAAFDAVSPRGDDAGAADPAQTRSLTAKHIDTGPAALPVATDGGDRSPAVCTVAAASIEGRSSSGLKYRGAKCTDSYSGPVAILNFKGRT